MGRPSLDSTEFRLQVVETDSGFKNTCPKNINMPDKVEENEDADKIVDEVSTNEMQGSSTLRMREGQGQMDVPGPAQELQEAVR